MSDKTTSAIERAIEEVGGQVAMAERLNISPQAVNKWARKKQAPADRCLEIEKATAGKVTRYQLRPDVFGTRPDRPAA